MTYIKITNSVDSVPRLYLELLGVSTKRDNDDTIGQFGSGTKFAPIYALREGWEWISVGYDNSGGYTMGYEISDDNDEGIDIVQFKYDLPDGSSFVKDSSYSMGAGELGWDHPFQIFREAFANALDAHYEFGADYNISYVEEVGSPVDGEFSVYLTACEEMMEVVDNFEKFFSMERIPLFVDTKGNKIYEKMNKDEGVRIYHKGVLVYGPDLGGSSVPSIFDYDLSDVVLNEERRLRDVTNHEIYRIATCIGNNEEYLEEMDGVAPLVKHIIKYGYHTSKTNGGTGSDR